MADLTFGIDTSCGEDENALAVHRAGELFYVCTVPRNLGNITGFTIKNGRVIAETDSGVPLIVPLP